MKKIILFTLIVGLSFQFTSCKSDEKKTEAKQKTVKTYPYSLKNATNTIGWIAYKTTDKIPVKGTFKKIDITKNGYGASAKEAINGAEFSIPVSSIFTSDVSRDFKLKKFFFGAMANTKLLSGKLSLATDSTGVATITMNSVTADLPFTYKLDGKNFTMNATMLLENWQAQGAVDSLNVACKDLHKAADGVSKTWNDVAINITTIFK